MAFNLISSTCDAAKGDTIAGCITRDQPYQIFNFLEQINNVESADDLCGTIDATLQWKRNLSEDFINCCEANRMESNFLWMLLAVVPQNKSIQQIITKGIAVTKMKT